jgi:hypothetical protein
MINSTKLVIRKIGLGSILTGESVEEGAFAAFLYEYSGFHDAQ